MVRVATTTMRSRPWWILLLFLIPVGEREELLKYSAVRFHGGGSALEVAVLDTNSSSSKEGAGATSTSVRIPFDLRTIAGVAGSFAGGATGIGRGVAGGLNLAGHLAKNKMNPGDYKESKHKIDVFGFGKFNWENSKTEQETMLKISTTTT